MKSEKLSKHSDWMIKKNPLSDSNYVPLISIVTISYNSVSLIEKTILSVLSQTFKDYEYIIIDGASKDKTVEIIKKYENQISLWVSEPDQGISDAFNKGIRLAKGKYIQLLNSGDVYQNSDVLKKISGELKSEVVTFRSCYANGRKIPGKWSSDSTDLKKIVHVSHQATFVERSIYERFGGYNTKFKMRMDYDFFFRVFKKIHPSKIDEVIIVYDENGTTGQVRNALKFEIEGMLSEYINLDKNYLFWLKIAYRPVLHYLKISIRNILFALLNRYMKKK